MNVDFFNWSVIGSNAGAVALLALLITYFFRRLEKKFEETDRRIDALEERIFLLATGKSLKDATLERALKRAELLAKAEGLSEETIAQAIKRSK